MSATVFFQCLLLLRLLLLVDVLIRSSLSWPDRCQNLNDKHLTRDSWHNTQVSMSVSNKVIASINNKCNKGSPQRFLLVIGLSISFHLFPFLREQKPTINKSRAPSCRPVEHCKMAAGCLSNVSSGHSPATDFNQIRLVDITGLIGRYSMRLEGFGTLPSPSADSRKVTRLKYTAR